MRIVNALPGGKEMLSRLRYRAALIRACAMATAILLTIAWMTPAAAIERVSNDRGGQIGTYLTKFNALRRTGQPVVIDGTCASACTLVVGMIPRDHICVTPRAVLAFHAAGTLRFTVRSSINQAPSTCGRIIRPGCATGSRTTAD